MGKDIEKFKEIMKEIDSRQTLLERNLKLSSMQFVNQEAFEIRKLKEELIQMYEQLEEPKEKPVIEANKEEKQ